MFFSFGLWNVLLLPMSLRELHATEFEYGLQEGLTSVGFVIGSFFMARFSARLPESLWVFVGLIGMGVCGLAYAAATSVPVAILLVMFSGFFNSPTSVARSVLLQRNTPRELRGRVFSTYYVMRDVIFLFGMAGAGLADIINVRVMIAFASILLFGAAAYALVAPGLGLGSLRAARARLADAAGAAGLAAAPFRPATLADFDLLVGKLPTFARLSGTQREAFLRDASIRHVPAGTRIVEHGDTASSAYFILAGSATAGIPEENGYRGLSTMQEGDFFGEIAALTGNPRTADVVADTDTTLLEVPADALRATMPVPEIRRLVYSTLESRLQTDRGGRPAPSRRPGPGGVARPADPTTQRRRHARLVAGRGDLLTGCLLADTDPVASGLRRMGRPGRTVARSTVTRHGGMTDEEDQAPQGGAGRARGGDPRGRRVHRRERR